MVRDGSVPMALKLMIAGVSLLATMPAQAAVYVLTVSGTTSTLDLFAGDQTDRLGLFGPVGQVMGGQAFSARWTIDTSANRLVSDGPPNGVSFQGGSAYADDFVIGSFTMAGVTIADIGRSRNPEDILQGIGSESLLSAIDNSPYSSFQTNVRSLVNNRQEVYPVNGRNLTGGELRLSVGLTTLFGRNLFVPEVYFEPFIVDKALGDSLFTANFVFGVTGDGVASNYYATENDINFASLTLLPGAVPEPASWAMLIAGFGLVGAAARRRRRAMLVVSA